MPILFTQQGFEKIKNDLDIAEEKRPEAVKTLTRARAMGDLSENGFYKGAKAELSDLDRRIREYKHLIKNAQVIVKPKSNDTIQIGHKVILEKN